MKPIKYRTLSTTVAIALGSTGVSNAVIITQMFPFQDTLNFMATDGDSRQQVDNTFFRAEANPFDSSLGTLDSATITWNIAISGTVVAPADSTAVMSYSYSGNFFVNAIEDGGGGGGGAIVATPGETKVESLNPVTLNRSFPSGASNNDAIWAVITGTNTFTLSWDTPVNVSNNGTTSPADYTSVIDGSATITYNYTPVPEPSALTLMAFATVAGLSFRRRKN